MPRFEPFPGLRYDPDRVPLADVVAPPYDVIDPDELKALQSRSPYNSVRIELPDEEADLDCYQAAAHRLIQWQAEGILRKDPAPTLYGYRMAYTDETGRHRQTVGVIGALGLEPPGTSGIFPHEETTPKAKSDRLQLLEATGVNTSPIWGLSLAQGLSALLIAPVTEPVTEPVTDEEGVDHQLWPIGDAETIGRIREAVSAAPIVIADGHHRSETALNHQRQAAPGGGSDFVMALVVELVSDQLSVRAIHRLISGLPEDVDIVEVLGRHFDLTPTEASGVALLEEMDRTDCLSVVTSDATWLLHPKPETVVAARQDLGSSQLAVALSDLPDYRLVFEHRLETALATVANGDAQAAVLLRPVTVAQIAATGRGGERMPPKTTFFWPKPRTGFVFREVGD